MHIDKIRRTKENGRLTLSLGWEAGFHDLVVIGGPLDAYRPFNRTDFCVCVRAEQAPRDGVDVRLPIHDFSVPAPSRKAEVEDALKKTLAAMLAGKRVWVGCMGGWGRTGLFLALLAKVCGVKAPVGYVRQYYSPRAIETELQEAYVDQFNVADLRSWLIWQGWTHRWTKIIFWWA